MARSLNKVCLLGNVGKDPELRSTQEGKEIASFSLATSESWKDKVTNEQRGKTEWHDVVVFAPSLVEFIKRSVKKGSKLYIEGSIQKRKWLDQSSVERYVVEVVLQQYNSTLILLDSRNSGGGFVAADGAIPASSNAHGGGAGGSGDAAHGSHLRGRANGDGAGGGPLEYEGSDASVSPGDDEIPF